MKLKWYLVGYLRLKANWVKIIKMHFTSYPVGITLKCKSEIQELVFYGFHRLINTTLFPPWVLFIFCVQKATEYSRLSPPSSLLHLGGDNESSCMIPHLQRNTGKYNVEFPGAWQSWVSWSRPVKKKFLIWTKCDKSTNKLHLGLVFYTK